MAAERQRGSLSGEGPPVLLSVAVAAGEEGGRGEVGEEDGSSGGGRPGERSNSSGECRAQRVRAMVWRAERSRRTWHRDSGLGKGAQEATAAGQAEAARLQRRGFAWRTSHS